MHRAEYASQHGAHAQGLSCLAAAALALPRPLFGALAVSVMVGWGWLNITLRLFSSLRPCFRVFAFATFFPSSSTL